MMIASGAPPQDAAKYDGDQKCSPNSRSSAPKSAQTCLIATCDVPETGQYEPGGFPGVGLGIVAIATTSDGEVTPTKRNRVSQAKFTCRGCGVVAHADRDASRNIAARGQVAWDAGRESRAPAPACDRPGQGRGSQHHSQ